MTVLEKLSGAATVHSPLTSQCLLGGCHKPFLITFLGLTRDQASCPPSSAAAASIKLLKSSLKLAPQQQGLPSFVLWLRAPFVLASPAQEPPLPTRPSSVYASNKLPGSAKGSLFLFFFFSSWVYLFIYLFNLFLAVLGLRFCARAFSSCGEWGPLFIVVRGPLTVVASLVAEHRLQTRRLSNCGSRA